MTVVPTGMPGPVTEAPTVGELSAGFMVVKSIWPTKPWYVAPFSLTATSPDIKYVGERVGSTVGALLGEAEGLGVGLPTTYVGVSEGA